MNKTELLPKIIDVFSSMLTDKGYKYLKSKERFESKTKEIKFIINPNTTYWSSSNYCMVSPVIGVRVEKLENIRSNYLNHTTNKDSLTFSVITDNIENISFWTITNFADFENHKQEMMDAISNIYLPLIDNWLAPELFIKFTINNKEGFYHSELNRILTMFLFVEAFNSLDVVPQIIESIDLAKIKRSRNQQDPYYRDILKKMMLKQPIIGKLGFDL